ncbi:unnamed protein product [Angiostrongylus costaricensis]|uniref:Gamma-glutamyltransferase n=1 Tax=Angiostrongylus costaricensis TaxID=334426 RepID=A0A158PMK8_ANGCS|nr:unnamed protein product [Angiostrongylus costaricensis]
MSRHINLHVNVQSQDDSPRRIEWPLPSGSLFARFKKAAVASDHGLCSEVGRDVLIDGGNAVESMIATLLCIGVVNPQSSGLGGGFIMTLFNAEIFVDRATGRVYEEGDIMKRERYGFTLQLIANATDPVELFYKGGMAQTIAGEITDNGGYVDQKDLASYETLIDEIPLLSTGLPGDLEMCGPPPPSSFVITQNIIAVMAGKSSNSYQELFEIPHFGFSSFGVDLNDPLVYHRLIEAEKFAYAQRTKLGDMRFVESTIALVANMSTPKYAKWVASMIKDTAQEQSYYLGDSTSQVPDHGTSHVTVIDHEGNGVSCTSTINQVFGSMRASQTLGIIWNDEMDDFSTPGTPNAFGFAPSPSNFIAPGKRPMSSMSPMIIYNKNEDTKYEKVLAAKIGELQVVMAVGASGGSYIISATAQVVIRTMLFNQTVKVRQFREI